MTNGRSLVMTKICISSGAETLLSKLGGGGADFFFGTSGLGVGGVCATFHT